MKFGMSQLMPITVGITRMRVDWGRPAVIFPSFMETETRNQRPAMIIDGHTHAWRADDLETLNQNGALLDGPDIEPDSPYNWTPRFPPSVDHLLAAEKEAGVDRFVLLPTSRRPDRNREMAKWSTDMARSRPEIIPFAPLHPQSQTLEDDLKAAVDMGVQGIKVHTLIQGFNPVSPEAMTMYGLIEKSGLVMLMDSMKLDEAAALKPNLKPLMDMALSLKIETGPVQISEITRRFPGLKIIAAHMGYCYGWDLLDPILDLDSVYFDVSYVHRLMAPQQAEAVIRRKGTDRIVFGTDAPWRRPASALEWFLDLDFTLEEQARMLAGNLLELI